MKFLAAGLGLGGNGRVYDDGDGGWWLLIAAVVPRARVIFLKILGFM